jgi:hypothetical protein
MSTFTTRDLNSALPLSIPYKSTDQEARKTVNTTPIPALSLSLVTSEDFSTAADLSDSIDSGASFLLAIHRRREESSSPSQKMTRKEGEYLRKDAHPSLHLPNMRSSKNAAPPTQKMTKKERDSVLDSALDLLSED